MCAGGIKYRFLEVSIFWGHRWSSLQSEPRHTAHGSVPQPCHLRYLFLIIFIYLLGSMQSTSSTTAQVLSGTVGPQQTCCLRPMYRAPHHPCPSPALPGRPARSPSSGRKGTLFKIRTISLTLGSALTSSRLWPTKRGSRFWYLESSRKGFRTWDHREE